MPEYLTPGVYFERSDAPAPIVGLRTDIAAFIGYAESGPLHRPTRIDSWRQFESVFGGMVSYGYLAYAAKGFFENGGRNCFVVRIAGRTSARASLPLNNQAGNNVVVLRARNEGLWGNELEITLTRVNAPLAQFSLKVTRRRGGVEPFELFDLLSVDPANERYFVRIINDGTELAAPSQWIEAQDVIAPGAPRDASALPDGPQSGLTNNAQFLDGGVDGIASITMADFVGDASVQAPEKRGLSALERIDPVSIVCAPDLLMRASAPPAPPPPAPRPPHDLCCPAAPANATATPPAAATELPPAFSPDQVASMQRALIEHCERTKDRIAILDAPQRPDGRPLTAGAIIAWRNRFETARGFAALYYPWVKALDPLRTDRNPLRAIPACGHVAGIYARNDFAVGVHKAPANEELHWAEDVTAIVEDNLQGVLNPIGINCLRAFPGRGIRVYGGRTMSSDSDWRYVNVRRLMLMIEEAVDKSTQWAVFEPHQAALRETLRATVSNFLETLWTRGALAGQTAAEAYYVKCDETTNPPESMDAGRLITEVGVAPTKPAEFIVFRIGRTREEWQLIES